MSTTPQEQLAQDLDTLAMLLPTLEPMLYITPIEYKDDFDSIAGASAKIIVVGKKFAALPRTERYGVLLHECWHLLLQHVTEAVADRNRVLVNIAMDIVINQFIRDLPQYGTAITLPAKGVNITGGGRYVGLAWQEVYDLLLEQASANGGAGDSFDEHEFDPSAAEDLAAQVITAKNIIDAGGAGVSTGRWLESANREVEITTPPLHHESWTSKLNHILTSTLARSYPTWMRVDRRAFAKGEYARSYTSPVQALAPTRILVDTSGSMEGFLATALQDAYEVVRQLNPQELDIVYYDTRVCEVVQVIAYGSEVLSISDITHVSGGGGTCVTNALAELQDDKITIVITDGEDELRAEPYGAKPAAWIVYDNDNTGNTGITLRVDTMR